MKRRAVALLLTGLFLVPLNRAAFAQEVKLALLVVLDQFPYDYLQRFESSFSDKGGFRLLLHRGANFANARYMHAYTKTAPGHAALATGTYARTNGVSLNWWYDRKTNTGVDATRDTSVRIAGTDRPGQSPHNLMMLTAGDMLRMQSNFRSKVIALSNKDRSAVLLAGKFGRGFWMEDSVLAVSTASLPSLPSWAAEMNASGLFREYFGRRWTESNAAAARLLCDEDDVPYEVSEAGLGRTFPHPVTGTDPSRLTPSYWRALACTPFATDLLLRAARRAVIAESLGGRNVSDMLCISISATDEIGHSFGPMSRECFDNVLKTDSLLGEFFTFLDQSVGLAHCVIVLSSDHGVAPIPEYLKKQSPGVDAGRVSSREILHSATSLLARSLGEPPAGSGWVSQVAETEIYLNSRLFALEGKSPEQAQEILKDSLPALLPVVAAYTRGDIERGCSDDLFLKSIRNSFFPARSGDVFLVLKPYYIVSGEAAGTNHGTPYSYDSHVPIIFLGSRFTPGTYLNQVEPVDVAPTLCAVLGIEFPPGRDGRVLTEAIR